MEMMRNSLPLCKQKRSSRMFLEPLFYTIYIIITMAIIYLLTPLVPLQGVQLVHGMENKIHSLIQLYGRTR